MRLGALAAGCPCAVVSSSPGPYRIADGADRVVAPGTLARFADDGLVFADGARIRLIPFERLR